MLDRRRWSGKKTKWESMGFLSRFVSKKVVYEGGWVKLVCLSKLSNLKGLSVQVLRFKLFIQVIDLKRLSIRVLRFELLVQVVKSETFIAATTG